MKKLLFIIILLNLIFIFYGNEKEETVKEVKNSPPNYQFSAEGLTKFQNSSSANPDRMFKAGKVLTIVGAPIFGAFYILGFIADSVSWAALGSDTTQMGAGIGVSFIPLVGLFIVPAIASTTDLNSVAVSSIVAGCVTLGLLQLIGFAIMITGIALMGYSRWLTKQKKVSFIIDARINRITQSNDVVLGTAIKF